MKLVFLFLVLVNVLLFAWQQGAFGRFAESGREPERLSHQLESGRIRILSEKDVQQLKERAAQSKAEAAAPAAPPAASAPVPAAATVIDLSAPQACVEFGDFIGADVPRAEAALFRLGMGPRQSTRTVEVPGWTMVYLPPFKTRIEVDRAVADLGRRGVKDVQVLGDGPLRLGVSLGSFKDAELARAHLASLEKRGVQNARLSATAVSATRFQLRELTWRPRSSSPRLRANSRRSRCGPAPAAEPGAARDHGSTRRPSNATLTSFRACRRPAARAVASTQARAAGSPRSVPGNAHRPRSADQVPVQVRHLVAQAGDVHLQRRQRAALDRLYRARRAQHVQRVGLVEVAEFAHVRIPHHAQEARIVGVVHRDDAQPTVIGEHAPAGAAAQRAGAGVGQTSTRSMPPALACATYAGIQSSPSSRRAISTTM